MTKPNKPKRGRPITSEVVPSTKAAAEILKCTTRTLRNYRAQGCPGFDSDGVVDVAKVRAWIETHLQKKEGSLDSKEEKLREEIRKLRIANDAREGRLVENAWVLSRFQIAAGELNGLRAKSEAEHPVRFAAAAGDVAACRTVVRGIWDDIFATLQSTITKHLEEGPTS